MDAYKQQSILTLSEYYLLLRILSCHLMITVHTKLYVPGVFEIQL